MSISSNDVAAFLDAEKRIAQSAAMRWTRRNLHTYTSRMAIESGGAAVGEVFFVFSVALDRNWSFKVLRRRAEILRWDFTVPPTRHRNSTACGDRYPRVVRALEHEHLWHPTQELDCVTPLSGLADLDHKAALDAFCGRAKIDMESAYTAPPPHGEQLAL
jgi:hypothetical protein